MTQDNLHEAAVGVDLVSVAPISPFQAPLFRLVICPSLIFRFSVKKSDSIVPGFMQAIFYRTETNGIQISVDFWNRLCSICGCEKKQREYRSDSKAAPRLL